MVFQNPFSAVNPKMKIEKVIMEPWNIRKIGSCKEGKKKVEEMLSMVGLESSLKNRYPLEVSGGQLQRVLLARSLMLEPDLLIADESDSISRFHCTKTDDGTIIRIKRRNYGFTNIFKTT